MFADADAALAPFVVVVLAALLAVAVLFAVRTFSSGNFNWFLFGNEYEAELLTSIVLLLIGADWTLLLGGRDLLFNFLRYWFVVDRVARKITI